MMKPLQPLNDARIADRIGITLVELIVIMAVLAGLLGLLLPAVQAARESARKTQCSNNLKQICIAIHNYEANWKTLPVGEGGSGDNWMTELLPFLEQRPVYDQIKSIDPNTVRSARDIPVSRVLIAQFICPSNPFGELLEQVGKASGEIAAKTSYVGSSGTNYLEADGVFLFMNAITFSEITDGLSHTLLTGERPAPNLGYYGTWLFSGRFRETAAGKTTLGVRETADLIGHSHSCDERFRLFSKGDRQESCHALHFWSFHPGGAHFALVDGSVRFIGYENEYHLLNLATRNGSENILIDF